VRRRTEDTIVKAKNHINNLFNDDGTFKENGGATKPKKFDADITVHQIVTDRSELKLWLKIPQKTDWRRSRFEEAVYQLACCVCGETNL
jgi:hypothetical protein